MLFSKPKPTVSPEDKDWIEDTFLWFEKQYGSNYLKSIQIVEPTRDFFDHEFTGKEEDAEYLLNRLQELMDIKGYEVELDFFTESPMEFSDDGIGAKIESPDTDENSFSLGKYSEKGRNRFKIELEINQLKSPESMIATLAHELSHLILLGENRLDENDEELTDLNCIALGFGIFTSNNIFSFQQWQGATHQGWQANRQGYIPEEVAAYAMALINKYQNNMENWPRHLNKRVRKMYDRNIKFLNSNIASTKFPV